MANPVRPWLKKFLATEIREAISCKREKIDDPDAPQPTDLQRFSDDGSTYRNEVVAADSAWPEVYVQARQVLNVKPLQMLLGDGQHTVIATFDSKTVKPYEEDIDEDIKLGRKGDILRLEMYTVVTTTHGPQNERVKLHVKMLHYVHTQPKLMGAPIALCDDREITGLVDRVARLQRSSLASEAFTDSRQGSVVAPSPGNRSVPSGHQSPASVKDTATVAPQMLVTQVGPVVQTQAFPTPQNPRRSTALRLEDDGLEIQTGDNLAEPRTAGLPKIIRPEKSSLLSIIGKKPQISAVSKPEVSRPSQISPIQQSGKAMISTPTTNLLPDTTSAATAASQEIATPNKPKNPAPSSSLTPHQDGSLRKPQAGAKTIKPAATLQEQPRTRVHIIDDMASDTAGRAARGRHDRIPTDQLALLEKKNCWPRSVTTPYTPYNIPEVLLVGWNKAAKAVQTAAESSREESSEASDMEIDEPANAVPKTVSQAPSLTGRESMLNSSPEPWTESVSSKQRRETLPPESSQAVGEISPPPSKARKPAEAPQEYRDHRRQWMTREQRLYWLKLTYGCDDAPAFSALEASEEYTKKYPADPVTTDDMKALYTTDIVPGWQTNKTRRQHTPLAGSEHDEATASEHESIEWSPSQRLSQKRILPISREDITGPSAAQPLRLTLNGPCSIPQTQDSPKLSDRSSLSRQSQIEYQAGQAGEVMEIELDDGHTAHNEINEGDGYAVPAIQAVAEETAFIQEVLIKHSGEGAQEAEDLYDTSQTPPRVPATILKTIRHSTEISQPRITPPAFEKGAPVIAATVRTKQQKWAKSWLQLPREGQKRSNGKHLRDANNHVLLWKLP